MMIISPPPPARLALALLPFLLAAAPTPAHAYIPAQATNDTALAQAQGLNTSDVSLLTLQWAGGEATSETVSYSLVGADSQGLAQGALVHFSEDNLNNDTTSTPWIALISCDKNSTHSDPDEDIFTLAKERGAIAALLYTVNASSCLINPYYSNPANFDQVMDVYMTQSLKNSVRVESVFNKTNSTAPRGYYFSASVLNDSSAAVTSAINGGPVNSTGLIFATLSAWNVSDSPSTTNSTPADPGSNRPGGAQSTSLAMIILYAITGCVSALFCVVIVSGAIRAIRHPERYGPRSGDAFGPDGTLGPQSRAGGLTRAILDTFPVVKFGGSNASASGGPAAAPAARTKDIESTDESDGSHAAVELRDLEEDRKSMDTIASERRAAPPSRTESAPVASTSTSTSPRASSSTDPDPHAEPRAPVRRPQKDAGGGEKEKDVVPDAIGHETCPICIVDFEEGDDLRVLPCEGHHRFHPACVDQWLLELSSSCPICRQDFQALQTMMTATDATADAELEPPPALGAAATPHRPLSSAAARFSRYLRVARHRRRAGEGEGMSAAAGPDPTNPYAPLAPRTTLQM
ncbi:uncharacterized protein BXZ73DRAFT_88050 [Epithele typhae]|uniref:uncharacterized protein n=1 Tax=Epithele typhae TaxID=378194 RepID=UPI002007C2B9|nr:uncharacterized protein BXZ73DRAFT_88050 [Epithele typhae]KAH9942496.1 hypothetical protein BXZ73DRAFT_88050 [Epithele typhae]